jgi:putative PIN family toxin of toxin-antitoxin system
MRVVFDTNIYISAFLFPGKYPEFLLDRALQRNFDLYISNFILEEFARVLGDKFRVSPGQTEGYLRLLRAFTITTKTKSRIDVIKESHDDNRILELAIDAKAAYLVTGDKKHLLSLGEYKGIKIVSVREFLKLL